MQRFCRACSLGQRSCWHRLLCSALWCAEGSGHGLLACCIPALGRDSWRELALDVTQLTCGQGGVSGCPVNLSTTRNHTAQSFLNLVALFATQGCNTQPLFVFDCEPLRNFPTHCCLPSLITTHRQRVQPQVQSKHPQAAHSVHL